MVERFTNKRPREVWLGDFSMILTQPEVRNERLSSQRPVRDAGNGNILEWIRGHFSKEYFLHRQTFR